MEAVQEQCGVHDGVHLFILAPEVGSRILGILTHINVQFLLLLKFFTNYKVPLFDNELNRKTIFHDFWLFIYNLFFILILQRCLIIGFIFKLFL